MHVGEPAHAFIGVQPGADAQAVEDNVLQSLGVPAQAVPYAATTHPGAVEVQSHGAGVPTHVVSDPVHP